MMTRLCEDGDDEDDEDGDSGYGDDKDSDDKNGNGEDGDDENGDDRDELKPDQPGEQGAPPVLDCSTNSYSRGAPTTHYYQLVAVSDLVPELFSRDVQFVCCCRLRC